MYNKYKPHEVYYEKNIETKLFEDLKGKWLPMKAIKTTKDKHTRLSDYAWDIEFGRVFLHNTQTNLEYEITTFPDLEHDDEMDGFLIAMQWSSENNKKRRWVSVIE